MFDPYEVLGLDKNSSQDMIKQRWRSLMQQWHPDKFQNESDEEKKEEANKMFEAVQEAYKILGDVERKKLYDDTGFIEPPQNEISRSVETTLKTLITSYLMQGDRIFTVDIIKEVNKYCDTAMHGARKKIVELKGKRIFLSKVVQKFTRKKRLSRDFLNNIFLTEFNAIDQAVNSQLKIILVMTQVKSVINAYEFDFMHVIDGPPDLNTPPNRVSLGNIFELAGVKKTNGR